MGNLSENDQDPYPDYPDRHEDREPELISCDNCPNRFDADGDEDCQVGGDRSQGEGWPDRAVPSLCPACYEKAMRGP